MAMATLCSNSLSAAFSQASSHSSWKSDLHGKSSKSSKRPQTLFIGTRETHFRKSAEAQIARRFRKGSSIHRIQAQSSAEASISAVETVASTAEEETSATPTGASDATAETASPTTYEVSYRNGGAGANWERDWSAAGKGWLDEAGNVDERLLAKFRRLAIVAGDRVEMHQVLATQRDNWNHLFHSTIVILAVSAAFAAALNGAEPAAGLSVVAFTLNLACAALMALISKEQPSQLAEEQRRASRFFRRLFVEVEQMLEIEPEMREDAASYWEEQAGALHALDADFPLPLTPQGRNKFPRLTMPAKLSQKVYSKAPTPGEDSTAETDVHIAHTRELVNELGGDVMRQIRWAGRFKKVNFIMAQLSNALSLAAAVFCLLPITPAASVLAELQWLPAVLTVAALFTHSIAHALQLGSGFEIYRNCAGYYREIIITLSKVLTISEKRQDWSLLLHDVSLRLGLDPNEIGKPVRTRVTKLF